MTPEFEDFENPDLISRWWPGATGYRRSLQIRVNDAFLSGSVELAAHAKEIKYLKWLPPRCSVPLRDDAWTALWRQVDRVGAWHWTPDADLGGLDGFRWSLRLEDGLRTAESGAWVDHPQGFKELCFFLEALCGEKLFDLLRR